MTKPHLTIAIPTYRNYQQLRWTLESLLRYTEYPYQIVVVNNGGPDDDDLVRRLCASMSFPDIAVLTPGENLGWMAAHNKVLEDCDTPFYCMLNDDVTFPPNSHTFWRGLLEWFGLPDVGAVGPGSNFVAGPQSILTMDPPPVFESSYLIGFCCLFRTEVLKAVGGLDASLPGGDDLDWSIRLRRAGYRLIGDKNHYLHHFGQQTGKRLKGEAWDSQASQEETNKALIRKHGLAAWYDCFTGGWRPVSGMVMEREEDTERHWYQGISASHKGERGANIGCGATRYGEAVNVDRAKRGAHGAGGMKFQETDTDIVSSADDLPFEDGEMDYLLCSHILEHLIDPIAALKEWRRILKPGGKLYLSLPDHEELATMAIDVTHVHAYTVESVKTLLSACGFSVEECYKAPIGAIRIKATRPKDGIDHGEYLKRYEQYKDNVCA